MIRECAPQARDCTHRRYRYKDGVDEVERAKNRTKSRVRSKVEHVFAVMKLKFGFVKLRFRGLKKNATQLFAVCALVNLYLARKKLLLLAPALALPCAKRRRWETPPGADHFLVRPPSDQSVGKSVYLLYRLRLISACNLYLDRKISSMAICLRPVIGRRRAAVAVRGRSVQNPIKFCLLLCYALP